MKGLILTFLFAATSVWASSELTKIKIEKKDQKNLKNPELIYLANEALQGLEGGEIYYGIEQDMSDIKIVAVYKNSEGRVARIDLVGDGLVSAVDKEFGDPVLDNEPTTCYVAIEFEGDNKNAVDASCDIGDWL